MYSISNNRKQKSAGTLPTTTGGTPQKKGCTQIITWGKRENNMTNTMKDIALLLTQYETAGTIGRNEFLQYFIDEELEINENMISDYNEYLSENGYETYWDDLETMLSGMEPLEIARATFYGNFKFAAAYHQFNGYANIDSFEAWEIEKEMKSDKDFLEWYIEENCLIDWDSDELEKAVAEANKLLTLGY